VVRSQRATVCACDAACLIERDPLNLKEIRQHDIQECVVDSTHHREVGIVRLEGKSSVRYSHSHLPSVADWRRDPAREEDNCTVGEGQRLEEDNQPGCTGLVSWEGQALNLAAADSSWHFGIGDQAMRLG
jgi:hypothetical protein